FVVAYTFSPGLGDLYAPTLYAAEVGAQDTIAQPLLVGASREIPAVSIDGSNQYLLSYVATTHATTYRRLEQHQDERIGRVDVARIDEPRLAVGRREGGGQGRVVEGWADRVADRLPGEVERERRRGAPGGQGRELDGIGSSLLREPGFEEKVV